MCAIWRMKLRLELCTCQAFVPVDPCYQLLDRLELRLWPASPIIMPGVLQMLCCLSAALLRLQEACPCQCEGDKSEPNQANAFFCTSPQEVFETLSAYHISDMSQSRQIIQQQQECVLRGGCVLNNLVCEALMKCAFSEQ